jgi:hypothetical protein
VTTLAFGIIAAAFALALASVAGKVRFRKYPDKLFASRIQRTVGAIRLSNSGSPLNEVAVHVVGPAQPPQWIGLTIQNGQFVESAPITPVMLSIAEARQLAALLEEATRPPSQPSPAQTSDA